MKLIGSLLLAGICLGSVVNAIQGEVFQFDRNWVGRICIRGGLGTNPQAWQFQAGKTVPATLSGRLDDVADTFTLDSLVYEDGFHEFNRTVHGSETFFTPPTDFPNNQGIYSTLRQSLVIDRFEWTNAPAYFNTPPGQLTYAGGDIWSTEAIPTVPLEPIMVRVLGEFVLTLDDQSVATPVDVTLSIDPQWTGFSFATGYNYPTTLAFGGASNEVNPAYASFSATIGNYTRSGSLSAYFVHVPEPSSAVLALSCTAVCGIFIARRRTALTRNRGD